MAFVYAGRMHTIEAVLAHHGILPTPDSARDHGVLYACLGCKSIATAPAGMTTEDYKSANPWLTPDLLAEWAECCPDANSVTF